MSENNVYPLLNSKWEPCDDDSFIKGTWAEDDSEYVIKVPSQLRQSMLLMQNKIYDSKVRLNVARDNLLKAEKDFNKMLGIEHDCD